MWFKTKPPQRLVCLWLAFGVANSGSWAKGLKDLTPEPPASATQDLAPPSVPGEELDHADPSVSEKPAEDMVRSGVSQHLADKLFIGTSYGFAFVNDGDVNWRASGSSDVSLAYKLGIKLAGGEFAGTFRYVPMDVAPHLDNESPQEAYSGVLEGYLFGGEWSLNVAKKLNAVAAAELGAMVVHVNDMVGLIDEDQPEGTSFAFVLGGGADYQLFKKWLLGARLRLGAGKFSTFQLSGNLTFAF